MNLLLTSDGVSNDSIALALDGLTGQSPSETNVAFIPTAANPLRESKNWMIQNMHSFAERNYNVDVVELTALGSAALTGALERANVICFGGGNPFYLSYWLQKRGLVDTLPSLLKTRTYVGISAGSMIAGKSLALASYALENPVAFKAQNYGALAVEGESSGATLGYADLVFRPHFDRRYFFSDKIETFEAKAREFDTPVYGLDDQSALAITEEGVTVVSEGKWVAFNSEL